MALSRTEVRQEYQRIRDKYAQERRRVTAEEQEEMAKLQAQCSHEFKLKQVAGEGKYCIHCALEDWNED